MRTTDYPALLWRDRSDGTSATQLNIELSEPFDSAGFEHVESVIELFCMVASMNGFCPQTAELGGCICRTLSIERLRMTIRVELDCQRVDYRAFQVLRNMIAKLQENGVWTRELTVWTSSVWLPEDSVAPLIDEDNEEQSYPPLHCSASLDFGDEGDYVSSWFRRCVVSMRVPVEQVHVDALRSLANPWFDVIEAGGFAMPLDFPWAVASVGDTVTQFDECSMEVTVLRFQASEEAWSVLANLIYMNASALNLEVIGISIDK